MNFGYGGMRKSEIPKTKDANAVKSKKVRLSTFLSNSQNTSSQMKFCIRLKKIKIYGGLEVILCRPPQLHFLFMPGLSFVPLCYCLKIKLLASLFVILIPF